jgi:hypothetical protein
LGKWQNGKLAKWQIGKMANWQNIHLTRTLFSGNRREMFDISCLFILLKLSCRCTTKARWQIGKMGIFARYARCLEEIVVNCWTYRVYFYCENLLDSARLKLDGKLAKWQIGKMAN